MNVYIIQCRDFYKVGLANEPTARLADLQIGNPYNLILCHSRRFPTRKQAKIVEREMHRTFAKDRKIGEWFSTDLERLKGKLDSLAEGESSVNKSKTQQYRSNRAKVEQMRLQTYRDIKAKTDERVEIDRFNIQCLLTSGIGCPSRIRAFLGVGFPLVKGWQKKTYGKLVDRIEFLRLCDENLK